MADVSTDRAIPLFVYGTLRDGVRLAEVLGDASQWRYLGPATVTGDLYDAGEYPALLLRGDRGRDVEGLLVDLGNPPAALTALDLYEGVGAGLYVRQRCAARRPDGTELIAWVYEYNRSVEGLRRLDDSTRSPDSWSHRFERRK